MIADVPQQVDCGHAVGIETGDEIAHVVRQHFAIGPAHFTIDTQRDTTVWQIERLANVLGII